MKALIIGGTSNLGREVSKELEKIGYEIITISRSEKGLREDSNHFQCDVSDENKYRSLLEQISDGHPVIDGLWCIAGYANPTRIEDQSSKVGYEHWVRNVNPFLHASDILKENLHRSKSPRIVTLGSQWTYRSINDCPELAPYAKAKIDLMKDTQNFALSNPGIKTNHYCIPTTNTGTYRKIESKLQELTGKEVATSHEELADSQVVANSLVGHATGYDGSGEIFSIDPKGEVEMLSGHILPKVLFY